MPRRKQKLSRAKARTMWLAWCAWGVFGSIFLFEDTMGGSGVFAWILTAPFWLMFAVWPFLWLYLRSLTRPGMVEIDDDIVAGDIKVRMVQSDGVRYAEKSSFEAAFGITAQLDSVEIPGGDERFVRIDDLRPLAEGNESLRDWIAVVDSLPAV